MLVPLGKTADGKIVVKGVGKFYFEKGLPLVFCFDELQQANMIPSWIHLYMELVGNGMDHDRIMHLLHENVGDAYGKKFRDEIIERIENWSRAYTK